MKREQDKKPDFLRDINTAIMEELTAGGIKDNAEGLAGELKEVEEVTELCGLRFNGYLAKVETPRPRGTLDEVIVAFTDAVISKAEGDIAGFEIAIGSKVLVSGKVQTLKDFESGRVLVFILADFVGLVKSPMMQDDVALRGVIAHEPVYRTTPRGKRITDISVMVKNELTGNKCFIPCICWQEQADEVAGWQQGDTVELLGRYQSRQYEKVIDTDSGSRERRTAYEISVQLINRKERAGNEKQNNSKRKRRAAGDTYRDTDRGRRGCAGYAGGYKFNSTYKRA